MRQNWEVIGLQKVKRRVFFCGLEGGKIGVGWEHPNISVGILSLSLLREIVLLIKPVNQPDFALEVLPPEYSAFHAFLSFLSRILGVFRQGH